MKRGTPLEAIACHFDEVAAAYDAGMARCGWAANDYLREELTRSPIHVGQAADLGSGTGSTVEVVLDCADPERLDAVDISANMAERLCTRFRDDPRVVVGNMAVEAFLAKDGDPYDLITAMGVWAFSDNQRALTAAAARRLAKGGRLVFTYAPILYDGHNDFPIVHYGDRALQVLTHRQVPENVTADVLASGLSVDTNMIFSSQPLRDPIIKAGFVVATKPLR